MLVNLEQVLKTSLEDAGVGVKKKSKKAVRPKKGAAVPVVEKLELKSAAQVVQWCRKHLDTV